MIVSYRSEPLLAHSSFIFISEDKRDLKNYDKRLASMLVDLKNTLLSSHSKPGDRGELIAQVLCMRAFDRVFMLVNEPKNYPRCPTVQEFLRELVGDEKKVKAILDLSQNKEKDLELLLKGKVNFNHFTQIYGYTPTRADMTAFMKRRAAIACQAGQAGIDFIIPVLLEKTVNSDPVSSPTEIELAKEPSMFEITPGNMRAKISGKKPGKPNPFFKDAREAFSLFPRMPTQPVEENWKVMIVIRKVFQIWGRNLRSWPMKSLK